MRKYYCDFYTCEQGKENYYPGDSVTPEDIVNECLVENKLPSGDYDEVDTSATTCPLYEPRR